MKCKYCALSLSLIVLLLTGCNGGGVVDPHLNPTFVDYTNDTEIDYYQSLSETNAKASAFLDFDNVDGFECNSTYHIKGLQKTTSGNRTLETINSEDTGSYLLVYDKQENQQLFHCENNNKGIVTRKNASANNSYTRENKNDFDVRFSTFGESGFVLIIYGNIEKRANVKNEEYGASSIKAELYESVMGGMLSLFNLNSYAPYYSDREFKYFMNDNVLTKTVTLEKQYTEYHSVAMTVKTQIVFGENELTINDSLELNDVKICEFNQEEKTERSLAIEGITTVVKKDTDLSLHRDISTYLASTYSLGSSLASYFYSSISFCDLGNY